MATSVTQPTPTDDQEPTKLEQIKDPKQAAREKRAKEGFIPDPASAISKGLEIITGGGIVKDKPAGEDLPYEVTGSLQEGTLEAKTTGDMAQQSIEAQTQPLSQDEFYRSVESGEIVGVGDLKNEQLRNMLRLSRSGNIDADTKEKINNRLSNAYRFYSSQQDKPKTELAFGQETAPGEFQFAPTPEAKQNPKLKSVQKNIFEGKKAIAQVVSGAFSSLNLPSEDQKKIENIFVRNLSTGNFWDVLVEKVKEGTLRGTGIYLPDIAVNYGWDAIKAAAVATTIPALFGITDSTTFIESWEKGSVEREAASAWWRSVAADEMGIKELSQVMNEMVVNDLERQLASGDIDRETFDRLTTSTVETPGGESVTVANQFVTEEMAQTLLNTSVNKLSTSQQYGVVLAEAVLTMGGVGKAKQAKGNKQTQTIIQKIAQITERAANPDATPAEINRAAKLGKMTLIQAGRYLEKEKEISKFNESAVLYAMGMDRVSGNFKRITEEKDSISIRMKDHLDNGGKMLDEEYRLLQAEKKRLTGMQVRSFFTGRFIPNAKENFVEAAPLSMAMYYGGQYSVDSGPDGWFGGDRFAGEGMSALLYMALGKPAVTLAGKSAYWVNQQGGDIANKALELFETVVSIPSNLLIGKEFKGFLRDGSIENYEAALGIKLDADVKRSLSYIGRIAGKLDEEGLDKVVVSMQKHQKRLNEIVSMFPQNEQLEIRELLQENIATTSSIGWLQSAQQLSRFNVDARDAGSLENLSENFKTQGIIQRQSDATTLLVKRLKDKVANRTDLDDPGEITRYIEALEEANNQTLRKLGRDTAQLNKDIRDYRSAVVTDPSADIPAGILESLDEMELELNLSINPDLDQVAFLDKQYTDNMNAIAQRAYNLSVFRNNDAAHIKQTARNLEMMTQNRFARMRKLAKRGFISLDKKAREAGTSISINKMILELAKDAPSGEDLASFFSKNSRFFVGPLGKRVYTVANKMAKRSLESMEGSSYNELYTLHTTPGAKLPDGTSLFLGENPRPLDIMLFYMQRGEAPEFLATPGEVMDVYSAFRDYSIRLGDEQLASKYEDYAGTVESIVKEQAPELFAEWKQARSIYQMEWFDRIRVGGPLGKLHRSQNGPIKAREKLDESSESFFYDDVAIGEEIPADQMSDRLFRVAYKGEDPLTIFDPMLNNIDKALAGDDDALKAFIRGRDQFIQGFGEGVGDVFDLTTEQGLADFNVLRGNFTEVVYAKWGRRLSKQLGERLDLDIDAIKGGGYNFSRVDNVAEVQNLLTVAVKGQDGKVRKVKLVDLDRMIEEERSIAKLVNESNEAAENLKKYQTRILSDLDAVQDTLNSNLKITDEGFRAISNAMGIDDSNTFFQKIVLGKDADSIENLRGAVFAKLGDSFTSGNKTYSTAEVFDRAISQMIVDGMLKHGGLSPVEGRKVVGMNGEEYTRVALHNPANIQEALERPEVQKMLGRYIDSDHQEMISNIADFLSEAAASDRGTLDVAVKIDNIVSPMGTNQLISRAFNLARGMVSPQYVAAEFGVSLASQAGLDMMKLAAGNKEAADLMLQIMRFPKQMTKADLDTFDNLVQDFVISELGQMGEQGRQLLIELTTPPEGDRD